ncbi:hypothetical protein A3I57_00975 [Candidatus Beckwithbacteria bacterium RIFCSPLOWO2_02_FULL_47_23]|uniref:Uncharacterized protein n=1 Tax=Candidatus Beckwithbacteria bacterium RIFCSPLOWO2_02_FULL_47_23 TaxID=1797463 RepID=A0A1F5E2S0_9BACT|nr:MAG: hypothetical protein A3I57_00975 [Candidatus Beckwithbacteria bacterium RIFCSPLOWO2_02_FULL_47_23]
MVNLGLIGIMAKPFIGHHDWNGVFYSNIARNYLHLGLLKTGLGQVTDFGVITQPQGFYTHYPPLLTLIMAGWFKIFGVGDWQARLLPLLFTLGSLLVLVQLFNYLKFSRWATLAGLAVGLTPMWRYFSLMPSQEALIIFFSLTSVLFFLQGKRRLFYLSVILNGLSGWAGYFLYPWLWLLNKRRSWLLKAGIILVIIFLLHLLHTYLLTGSVIGGGLLDALLLRLNMAPPAEFTWWNYLILEKQRLAAFYTLILLAVAGVSTLLKRQRLIWALLGWGLSYPLIFSNVVFVHDYFNIFFIPWLAVAAAYLFNRAKPALVIVFVLLVFWERNAFYQALLVTESFKPGYELGRQINQIVPEVETAYVVGSDEFLEPQNLFVSYYADRKIIYLNSGESLPNDAKYVFNLDR